MIQKHVSENGFVRWGMDGSQKVCSAEKFTAVGNWGSSCWKTLEDFIELALEFPTLDEREEVFILQLQSVIC